MKKKISDMMDYIQDDSVQLQAKDIASDRIKEEVMSKLHTKLIIKKHTHRASRALLLAAIIVMVLSVSAFAIWHFDLKDMRGPTVPVGTENFKTLSLNGFAGMPEYEAAQEWEGYLSKWFDAGENMVTPEYVADEYSMYGAHSQEAKDTLDMLLVKYALKMHKSWTEPRSLDELYTAAGKENFLPPAGDSGEYPISGKLYDDGSLTFNCAAALSNGADVRYQLYSLTKGTFTRIGSLLADADDFEEWRYTTGSGADVLLAISENKSIMVADMESYFIFVNILSGTINNSEVKTSYGALPISKNDLETFAESFDFDKINSLS